MIFLDTTILPSLLVPRKTSAPSMKRTDHNMTVLGFLVGVAESMATSVLSPPILYKAGRQQGISDQTLKSAIAQYEMLAVAAEDYAWASEYVVDDDMVGALQVSVARRAGCRVFATTDAARSVRYGDRIKMLLLNP